MDDLDFVLAGVGKAATTWVHECFREHPEIGVPETDSLGYFDRNFTKGEEWYMEQLSPIEENTIVGESSPSYMVDTKAPARIADRTSGVTLLFVLRNPIDRAYSHWWHGYSDRYWSYEFDQILSEYPPYQMWATPGFYDHHLSRFDEMFDEDAVKIHFFDDLVSDDAAFIREIFSDVGADPNFTPDMVGDKMNTAHYEGPNILKRAANWTKHDAPDSVRRVVRPFVSAAKSVALDRSTYEEGMSESVRRDLEETYRDDVVALQERTGRDLSHWFEHVDL